MNNEDKSIQQFQDLLEYHPSYPLSVLKFLKSELKLGKKYVVAEVTKDLGKMGQLLLKHVHLVCTLHSDTPSYEFVKTQYGPHPNFLALHSTPENTHLDEDAVDCVLIDQSLLQFSTLRVAKELERILRLNSYVVVLYNNLAIQEGSFAQAYLTFFEQFSTTHQAPYTRVISSSVLDELYNESYEERVFHNQQRLTWNGLKAYYLSSVGALTEHEDEQYSVALKALKILYHQYQTEGEIVLDYDTHVVFGLFNKSVPAISLRKSIFFQILRPFAFGFYVLVKLNIYFWRGLFSIKEKLTKK